MIATAERRWWPLAVPLAVILGTALLVAMQSSAQRPAMLLVLAVQAAMVLLSFSRPVWLLGALVVGQLTAANYYMGVGSLQMSTRLLWTVVTPVLMVPYISRFGLDLGPRARRVVLPALAFFALTLLANAVYTDMDYTFKYFRQTAFFLAAILLTPALVREEKDVKILGLVAIAVGTVSGFLAILQHYAFKGAPVITILPDVIKNGRPAGLTEGAVQLSYYLPTILLPMLSVYLLKGVSSKGRWFLVVPALIMGLAMYFTYTRSAPVALAVGGLAMGLFFTGRLKREYLLVLLLVGGGFWWYTGMKGNRFSMGFTEESSGASRLVLWQAGMKMAMGHPLLGVGHKDFEVASVGYGSSISSYYMELQGAGDILGREKVHNDFLNIWLSFGTLALILFLILLGAVFWNFIEAFRRASGPFLKAFSLGCAGAVAGYAATAFLHNVMDTSAQLFIFAGLSLALTRMAYGRELHHRKEAID